MTKTEAAALDLRDHALKILRQHGRYVPLGDTKLLMWMGEGFDLWFRTPFQKWDTDEVAAQALAADVGVLPAQAKYLAAQPGLKLPKVLPYSIDISQGRKVFSLEWSDADLIGLDVVRLGARVLCFFARRLGPLDLGGEQPFQRLDACICRLVAGPGPGARYRARAGRGRAEAMPDARRR